MPIDVQWALRAQSRCWQDTLALDADGGEGFMRSDRRALLLAPPSAGARPATAVAGWPRQVTAPAPYVKPVHTRS